jgi:hypothetical protein
MPLVVSSPNTSEFTNSLFKRFAKEGKASLAETVDEIKREMSVEGKPITYPSQWDSEKQRRAYFASNGFGQGIPYVRKGNYIRGWAVAQLANGYSLSNKHPAGAVGGTLRGVASLKVNEALITAKSWQSNIHKDRWNNIFYVTAVALRKLSRRIMQKLRITTRND